MEKLLTYKDLEHLGLGTQVTIWRKIKLGTFPKPIKLGNKANSPIRFRESDKKNWIEKCSMCST